MVDSAAWQSGPAVGKTRLRSRFPTQSQTILNRPSLSSMSTCLNLDRGDSGRCHELPCMRPGSCGWRPERESVETPTAANTQVGASGKPGEARDITVDPYRCNA